MIIDKKKEFKIPSAEAQDEDIEDPNTRETWAHPCEFFLSCLGYAVGYGNIWRFPYLCFKNGGAAFLIPYVIILVIAGIPMFFMELALGQYGSLSAGVLFPEIAPILSGIGWAMLLTAAMITIFYNVVFAWSLFYTFASFHSVLPWSHCNNDFNSINCFSYDDVADCRNMSLYFFNGTCHPIEDFCGLSHLYSYNDTHCYNGINGTEIIPAERAVQLISSTEDYYRTRMLGMPGTTWENMGGMNWEIAGCLLLSWTLVALCMFKGIKSSGKAIYFFALFPYFVLVIFLIRGLTLEGAYQGIQFYILQPNITKLTEIQVWNDAATQIFYSLGIAYGSLITLSSYNKLNNNCMRDAITISLANCATSVFAGFVIFSVLGFMAHEINVPVKDVADSGSGLAFVAYPAAIARMPYPAVWSVLFFTMLIAIGIDSQFTFVETLAAGIFDTFESLRPKKPLVMVGLCFTLFLLGLPFCLNGGIYLFEIINTYAAGISVLFIAIVEVICIAYIYGFRKFMKNIRKDMGIHVPQVLYDYWSITWQFFTPASLLAIFALGIYYFEPVRWGSYELPPEAQFLGWLMTIGSFAPIPIFAVYVYCKSGKRGKELITPTDQFCPANVRYKNRIKSREAFKYIYDNDGYVADYITVNPITNEIFSSTETNGYGIVPILKLNSCDIEDTPACNQDITDSNLPNGNHDSNQGTSYHQNNGSHFSKESEENGDYYIDYSKNANDKDSHSDNENYEENSDEKGISKEDKIFNDNSSSEENSHDSNLSLKQSINTEPFLQQNIQHTHNVCKEIDLGKDNSQKQIENEPDNLKEHQSKDIESINQSINTTSNQSFSEISLNSDYNNDVVSGEVDHSDDIHSEFINSIDNSFEQVSRDNDIVLDDEDKDKNRNEIYLENDESKNYVENHDHLSHGIDTISDNKNVDSNTALDSVPEINSILNYNNEASEEIIHDNGKSIRSNENDIDISQGYINRDINIDYKKNTDYDNYSENKTDTKEQLDQVNEISLERIKRDISKNDFDILTGNKYNVLDFSLDQSDSIKEIPSMYNENKYQEEINDDSIKNDIKDTCKNMDNIDPIDNISYINNTSSIELNSEKDLHSNSSPFAKEEICQENDISPKCIKDDLDKYPDNISHNNVNLDNNSESESKYILSENDAYTEIKSQDSASSLNIPNHQYKLDIIKDNTHEEAGFGNNKSPECIKRDINYSLKHVSQNSDTGTIDKDFDTASSSTKIENDNTTSFEPNNIDIKEEINQENDNYIVCIDKDLAEHVGNSTNSYTVNKIDTKNNFSEQSTSDSTSSSECNFGNDCETRTNDKILKKIKNDMELSGDIENYQKFSNNVKNEEILNDNRNDEKNLVDAENELSLLDSNSTDLDNSQLQMIHNITGNKEAQ